MKDIKQIEIAIENFLIKEKKFETNPVEAGAYLHRIGLLKDSKDRPGKPLRDILRKGLLKHAYQNGNRWVIPRLSKRNLRPISQVSEVKVEPKQKQKPKRLASTSTPATQTHKLASIAKLIAEKLEAVYGEPSSYEFEYKPKWLSTIPDHSLLKDMWEVVDKVYSSLVDGKYKLDDRLKLAKRGQQSFDIWFSDPIKVAVEFDESQHFNQFRAVSLEQYSNVEAGFSIDYYLSLNQKNVGPGTTGFKKLKSNDPLFPEMYSGENQDNRVRQRAFRDTLKDLIPIALGFKPTIRIPYHVTNKSIKDFTKQDLQAISEYLETIRLFKS